MRILTEYKLLNVCERYYLSLLCKISLARPALRRRRLAYVLPMFLSFLNVAPLIRQRVDG